MIGVGIDQVDLDRFGAALTRRPALAGRLFSPDEREYASRRADPVERLAARFAAKEAVMKALGVGIFDVGLRDIEVVRADSGAPGLRLRGRAERVATERGVIRWHLSLTHTDSVAQAIAIAE